MNVYVDGCFDLTHLGHCLILKRARELGQGLVVGVCADENIVKYKAPAVLTLKERCEIIESFKSVDLVLYGVGHTLEPQLLDTLETAYNVAMVVHGDDATIMPDGQDAYDAAKKKSMFWVLPRTPAISTTDLVRALLTKTTVPQCPLPFVPPAAWTPKPKTVYVDGAFDCMHVGHIQFLKKARCYGTYLVVGLHSDAAVQRRRMCAPIMCMHDRARMLQECRYVDGIILDAPTAVTSSYLERIGPGSVVARGAVHETTAQDRDRYKYVPKRVVSIYSSSDMTVESLRQRILKNQDAYARKVFLPE